MIETYAFLAMFVVQILAMSALYPSLFIRYWRRQTSLIPPERLAQLYPGVDVSLARERFVARYRMLNGAIAVLGLVLLGALTSYLQRADWSEGPVEIVVTVYFLIQSLVPLGLLLWNKIRFNQAQQGSLQDARRRADLQRRGLFDFVAPFTVFVAGLSYVLFAAFVIYLQPHPRLGLAGLVTLGLITLVYALNAFVVHRVLYGKKANPFDTHANRVYSIGLTVKSCVYSCIVCVVFLALNLGLVLLAWQKWAPFALSAFFAIAALLSVMGMTAPPRKPGADELGNVAPPVRGT